MTDMHSSDVRMKVTILVLLVVMVLATGCTSEPSDTTTETADTIEADWLLQSNGPPITAMSSALESTLRIDLDNQCVTVSDGDTEKLLVFGENARLDITDPQRPVLAIGGARFTDGDQIFVGGGGWSLETMSTTQDPAYQDLNIPAACAEYGLFIVAPYSTR
jgi:hypothetical protein